MGDIKYTDGNVGNLNMLMQQARIAGNISLSEMARRLQCGKSSLWNIEHGRASPSSEIIQHYKQILGVDFPETLSIPCKLPNRRKTRSIDSTKAVGIAGISLGITTSIIYEKIYNSTQRVWLRDSWFGLSVEILESAILACKATDIRALLLDPASSFARQRALDLNLPTEFAPIQIEKSMNIIKSCASKMNGRLQLKYNTSLPTTPILIFDDFCLVGYYFLDIFTHDAPWLEVSLRDRQPTRFGEILERDFEHAWSKAVETPN